MSKNTGANDSAKVLGFRNVANLGVVSFFTDVSTEMILGVLPFFVITELHATKALLGLMEGAAESLNYLFRVFSGVLSDRIGRRKPLVLLGYGLSTISKPFFAVASSWSDALVVRLADRVGKGVRTAPRDALISDSVREARAGSAFGLHRSLDQLGAITGPALAFALIPMLGMRGLFWASFIPGSIALFVLAFFVRDSRGVKRSESPLKHAGRILTRRFKLFLVVLGIFALGAYNFSFILVKAGALGVDGNTIPLVYAVLNVGAVLAGLPAGILADKFGKGRLLMVGFGLFTASSLAGLMITSGAVFAFAIALIYGLYLGTSESVQRALIPSFVPNEFKGTAYGVYYLVIAACTGVANLVFGALWDQVSMSAAFSYSLALSVAAIAGLAVLLARS